MIDLFGVSYVVLWLIVLVLAVAVIVLAHALGTLYLGSREAIERDGLTDRGARAGVCRARPCGDDRPICAAPRHLAGDHLRLSRLQRLSADVARA